MTGDTFTIFGEGHQVLVVFPRGCQPHSSQQLTVTMPQPSNERVRNQFPESLQNFGVVLEEYCSNEVTREGQRVPSTRFCVMARGAAVGDRRAIVFGPLDDYDGEQKGAVEARAVELCPENWECATIYPRGNIAAREEEEEEKEDSSAHLARSSSPSTQLVFVAVVNRQRTCNTTDRKIHCLYHRSKCFIE